MPRFLVTTLPTDDLGLLTRSLPIARELAQRRHTIVFCSPARAPSRLIADAGFENVLPRHALYDVIAHGRDARSLAKFVVNRRWRPRHRSLFHFLRELIPALPVAHATATADVWDMGHAGAVMGMSGEGFVRANVEAMKNAMEETRADAVLDFWNPFAVIAARALRKPLVTVIQGDAHPDNGGFVWWKERPPGVPTPVPAINRVLEQLALPPIRKVEDLALGDLTLAVGIPETDPLPRGSAIPHVGAILWERAEAQLPDSVLAARTEKPLIWVYSGNPRYGAAGGALDSYVLLRACVDALARPDISVVLTTGYHPLPKELGPLPSNFTHVPFVPGLAMAALSDLLIHHGGYGSCQTGLYAGKPAVIVPTFSERESNARRIEALGAGAMVPVRTANGRKQVDPAALRDAVDRVLADPTHAGRAKEAGLRLRAYGGAARAAELIDEFVSAITPGSSPTRPSAG